MTATFAAAPPPLHHLSGADAAWADALVRLVNGIPLFGVEKSVKLGPGELLRDRFLLGLKPEAWPRVQLEQLRDALAMPAHSYASMRADLNRANFLGLAYESGPEQRIFKTYVEFPVPARRLPGPTPGSVAAHLIYHGYKWDPDRAAETALTRYWWAPELTLPEIAHNITRHQAAIGRAEVRGAVEAIVALAAQRCDARRFQYIEAREGENPRVSYDLNIYPAQLTLADAAAPLHAAARALAVDEAALANLLAEAGDRLLGHVSAGTDRRGRDFLTLYYEY